MKRLFVWCLFVSLCFAREYEANLAGHLIIPSKSFIHPPKDAPSFLGTTGKFAKGVRNEEIGSIPSKGARYTDYFLPFKGQVIQGHSGVKFHHGRYFVLADNGLGRKDNSVDSMLYLHEYNLNFQKGTTKRIQTIFFKDPNKVAPFPIVLEGTKERYLTGGDFDPESFQIIGDSIWVGDEFGPFLLHFDKKGVLLEIFDAFVDGLRVISPNNPKIKLPEAPQSREIDFNLGRSKGFEGMASSKDGSKLYLLLEGSLYRNGSYEMQDGKAVLRILEFDVKKRAFTGRNFVYLLESPAHAIGDFNMINEHEGLVIERDRYEGIKTKACTSKDERACFAHPAEFKRVYKIALDEQSMEAKKLGFIDLLNINDPKSKSKKPLVNGKFVFPFETIEGVDVVDGSHIIVLNDNNFPFSSSREPNKTDDNEFILLEVRDFLR